MMYSEMRDVWRTLDLLKVLLFIFVICIFVFDLDFAYGVPLVAVYTAMFMESLYYRMSFMFEKSRSQELWDHIGEWQEIGKMMQTNFKDKHEAFHRMERLK